MGGGELESGRVAQTVCATEAVRKLRSSKDTISYVKEFISKLVPQKLTYTKMYADFKKENPRSIYHLKLSDRLATSINPK